MAYYTMTVYITFVMVIQITKWVCITLAAYPRMNVIFFFKLWSLLLLLQQLE